MHEYGGGAVWFHGDTTFFSEFEDSRLYRVDGAGAEPRPITPEPPEPHALRYADGGVTPDGATIVCVRERHEGGEVYNELVVASGATDRPSRGIVAGGHDFFMAPRLDPAGAGSPGSPGITRDMPWDGTELWVADVRRRQLGDAGSLPGGPEESVVDPQWSPDGVLHFCSDRTGWWNIYREDGAALTSLEDAEIGFPRGCSACRRYAFLDDGRIACIVTRVGERVARAARAGQRQLEPTGLDWTSFGPASLSAPAAGASSSRPRRRRRRRRSSPTSPTRGARRSCARSIDVELDPASISVPRAIEFPTGDGATAHAFYYPPTNAELRRA